MRLPAIYQMFSARFMGDNGNTTANRHMSAKVKDLPRLNMKLLRIYDENKTNIRVDF